MAHLRCQLYGHSIAQGKCLYCEEKEQSLIEIIFHYRHLIRTNRGLEAERFIQAGCHPAVRDMIRKSVNAEGHFITADGAIFTRYVSRPDSKETK